MDGRPQRPPRLLATLIGLGLAGAAASAAGFVLTITGSDSSSSPLLAAVWAGAIGAPIGVGLYAWYRRPSYRFAKLLVAAGFLWSLAALAQSGNEVAYSAGRVSTWLVEPTLVFILLAFPLGRLRGRADRTLVAAAAIIAITLYLPTALVVHDFPAPTPYSSCETDCPPNAFMVTAHEPAVVGSVIQPAREILTFLLFLGVMFILSRRIARDSRLARRVQAPVLAAAAARMWLLPAYILTRSVDPRSPLLELLAWLFLLTLPAIALAFEIGVLRWRLFLATALQHLMTGASASSNGKLRRVIAEAVQDPTLEVAYWAREGRGRWVNSRGLPVELPQDDPSRAVTAVHGGGHDLAALIHDPVLREYPGLLEATASFVRMALDKDRLTAELQFSTRELRASRARIQTSADAERRRIERDLHDGAQQHLVTLQMRLELALDLLPMDQARSVELLREVGHDAEVALEDVRSLAHGVYPSLLADRGLADALRAAGRRSPRPVAVEASGLGRYSPEIESAVYFCCLEALQNSTKHAGERAALAISLVDDEALRFEVRDDGHGFDATSEPSHSGLTNMDDRIAAVGGVLTIRSGPGEGTIIRGVIPLRPANGNGRSSSG